MKLTLYLKKIQRLFQLRLNFGKHAVAIMCSVVCFAFILTVLLLNVQIGYAVSMNGAVIGEARNLDEVESVVESAEAKLSMLLGRDYDLSDSISVSTTVISPEQQNADGLEEALITGVNGVQSSAVISVDGRIIGSLNDEAEARKLLDSILDGFRTEGATDVRFAEDVKISTDFVTSDILSSYDAIYKALYPLNANSDISLTVITTGIRTREEEIPYEVEFRDDDTLAEGSIEVLTPGSKGTKVVSEEFKYVNGVQTSLLTVSEKVSVQPVKEVCLRGTADMRCASKGIYTWPAKGELTSYFGYRDDVDIGSNNHRGIDIANCYGTEIFAADGGEVICAEYRDSYGYIVKIQHDNGDITWYAHLSDFAVSVGESVAQGELIGYMGSTGDSTGDHLHFEIHPGGGDAADPIGYLPW